MQEREKLKIIKESFKMLAIVLTVCIVYKLNIIYIVFCMAAAVFVNTTFLREEDKRKKYLKKFNDVVLYMEQMVYSFKKQPKIRRALVDAAKISSDEMKEIIEEAILNIDVEETEHIYEDSLRIIEEEYDCKRIRSLHEFVIKIERNGGEYGSYLDILLEDIREWSDNTLLFIKNVERVKRNVLISIFSTLITCGFMAYLIPQNYKYTSHPLYQLSSAIVIIIMLLVYLFVNRKLNFDWIKEKEISNNRLIIKYYVLVEKGYKDRGALSFSEKAVYKKIKKSLENEISKTFPNWVRDVAMNLQNDTVQSAIEESYENASFVLKRPIRKLLIDFEKYPVGIEPYDNWLKEFELPDIKSSMKMFYAMSELGKEESVNQLNCIIDRNNRLTRNAEEMKNKDRIGTAGLLTSIPMLVGITKIMIDMVLMIVVFTSSIIKVTGGG